MAERIRGRAWMEIRQHVLTCQPLCLMCKSEGRIQIATEVDHIKALKDGGDNSFGNLRGLCVEHHLAKTRADRGLKAKTTYGADGWPVTG